MPINVMNPPAAAVAAFKNGLETLALADDRFTSLNEEIASLPPAHPVVVSGLDTLAEVRAPRNLAWRNDWAEWSVNRIWRFFVSSGVIPVGVVEVIPRAGGDGGFEFLAFREGKPVERAVETFRNTISGKGVATRDAYNLHLLKVPGLCADFYWLRKPELSSEEEALDKSWMVPIFQAPVGFVAGRAYNPNEAFELLRKESVRVLETVFAGKLASGLDSAAGEEPLTV